MSDSLSSEPCRLCPPGANSEHSTRDHVKILMQSSGTGPSSVPDRVQKSLRSAEPEGKWSAIVHPSHPPTKDRVWLAVVSVLHGYFIIAMASDVSDEEIRKWTAEFVAGATV